MKSVQFIRRDDEVLLRYEPTPMGENILAKLCIDFDDAGNVIRYTPKALPSELKSRRPALQTDASLTIKKVFTLMQNDLVNAACDEDTLVFRFAARDSKRQAYMRVPGRIFGISQDVLISESVRLKAEHFCVGYDRRTSVIAKIAKVLDASERQIVIGGEDEDAIPIEAYDELLAKFPTTTNLEHYGETVIESYVQDYLTPKKDYGAQYRHAQTSSRRRKDFQLGSPALDRDRAVTLHAARDQLAEMLARDDVVPEEDWQQGVLEVLPALFPQYVAVIPKAEIEDVITKKKRYADFLLVDASGNVDVLEIKRAFGKNSLMMKRTYRENHIPARELTGGIAQIEKYIHLLLNWGRDGEVKLTEKARLQGRITDNLIIRFLNPRGLLLIGGCELDEDEQRDFDLIRRQYAHVADVITYDDLLQRLDRMLAAVGAEPTNAR